MKKIFILLFLMAGITLSATAQESKTMYIMKNGVVTYQSVVSEIDSVLFQAPDVNGGGEADIIHFYLDIYKDPQSTYDWRGEIRMQNQEQDPPAVIINKATRTITYNLPILPDWFTPDKMTVFPAVIQISEGATVSPNWNEPQDFSKDVVYTVTAEDGITKKVWTVKAPLYFTKEKWNVDYKEYEAAGSQNPNSIAIVGDYLNVSRTNFLINKSDGTMAEGTTLNTTGLAEAQNQAGQPWPFFVTNDNAGNMVGGTLNAWNGNTFTLFKWTSATADPEILMEFPTVGCGFGRKIQVLGDINEKALIISPNMSALAVGGHYLWKVEGGVADVANPVVAQTDIQNNSNGYQLLSPLGLEPEGPYYVSSTFIDGAFEPNLRFGELGAMNEIKGPYSFENSGNGWGDRGFHFLKLFAFDSKDMISTLTHSRSVGKYCFAIQERKSNTSLVPVTLADFEWSDADSPNGNSTGSFTMEKVGDDVLFYLFPTNKAIICLQLSKF